MKILIGCEFSGIVRDAFISRGHDVISCDLLPSERPGPHYQGDIRDIIKEGYDMLIAFPPCEHLSSSGARWFPEKQRDGRQKRAIQFFHALSRQDIEKIALENPVGIISTIWRKPDQYIQPYQFGHGETKKTCLWLKNLPLLVPTNEVSGRENKIHRMAPSPERKKNRSRTYKGIAEAMARQWG